MRIPLLIFGLIGTATAMADTAPGKGVFTACSACHGNNGEGNVALKAPNIAGMDAGYLERQLTLFRRGGRGTGDAMASGMVAAASALKNDEEVRNVAQFVAALPRRDSTQPLKGDWVNGRNYYNGICSACHDSSGKGNSSLSAPRLAGVDVVYLQRQYVAFKSGKRGVDNNDKFGKQMAKMAKALPDEKTENDVFAYIATLKP